jgi:tetratricopeptide (TPR) repeat protein
MSIRCRRGLLARFSLIAFLATAPALALPPAEVVWTRVQTRHFTLYGDARPAMIEGIGLDLERLRQALTRLNPQADLQSPQPTRIFVFQNGKAMAPYGLRKPDGEPAEVRGFFLRHRDGNYVVIDADPHSDPRQVIYHEYLHSVVDNNFPDLPLWFNEGLAEVYSTFWADGDEVRIGLPIAEHVKRLATHSQLPLEDLFAIGPDDDDYNEGSRRTTFYAQSWALVHYLLFDDDHGRPAQTLRYLDALSRGDEPRRAFETAFGASYREISNALREYLLRSLLPYRRYELDDLAVDTRLTSAELPRAAALTALGDLLVHVDPAATREVERHFRAALDLDARQAAAWAGLAGLRHQEGRHGEAQGLFEEALRLAPADSWTHYLYADSLLRRLVGEGTFVIPEDDETRATARLARRHFEASLRAPSPPADAYAGLGLTYLFDHEDLAVGVTALETAHRLLPGREDVMLNLGVLYSRAGQRDRARATLSRLAERSEEAPVRRAARDALARAEVEHANQLLSSGLETEALALLRRVLPDIEDRTFQAQLGLEIDRIAATVDHNRWVERFNLAVALAREENYDGALATIDEILANAKDGEIRHSAAELKSQLVKFRGR